MTGSMELQPDNGPRLSISIGPGSNDAVGSRQEFARRFAEEIRKLTGNMKGDHREKTGGLIVRMPEATGLAKVGSKLSLWSLKSEWRPAADDRVWTMRWELARNSLGLRRRYREVARNTSRDRQKKIVRLAAGHARGCRIAGVILLSLVVKYDCNP
ncbi:hypothetical protein BHM03_00025638 [Ensete ventricosum]|nr:hypothetical protein BHM03_00025638 [Ensete ventricosum]